MKLNFEEMKKNPIEWALYQEFVCQINVDLLPSNWQEPEILQKIALESSMRLNSKINLDTLKVILHEMMNNRNNYLNIIAQEASNIEWVDEDSEWQQYKNLLSKILLELNKIK